MATNTLLWEIMESEAIKSYYIEGAQAPAIIICSGSFVAPDAKRGEWFTTYFWQGIDHQNTKNLKQAEEKAKEILGTTKRAIIVRVVDKKNQTSYLKFSPTVATK